MGAVGLRSETAPMAMDRVFLAAIYLGDICLMVSFGQ
jgi:hypothetical protein